VDENNNQIPADPKQSEQTPSQVNLQSSTKVDIPLTTQTTREVDSTMISTLPGDQIPNNNQPENGQPPLPSQSNTGFAKFIYSIAFIGFVSSVLFFMASLVADYLLYLNVSAIADKAPTVLMLFSYIGTFFGFIGYLYIGLKSRRISLSIAAISGMTGLAILGTAIGIFLAGDYHSFIIGGSEIPNSVNYLSSFGTLFYVIALILMGWAFLRIGKGLGTFYKAAGILAIIGGIVPIISMFLGGLLGGLQYISYAAYIVFAIILSREIRVPLLTLRVDKSLKTANNKIIIGSIILLISILAVGVGVILSLTLIPPKLPNLTYSPNDSYKLDVSSSQSTDLIAKLQGRFDAGLVYDHIPIITNKGVRISDKFVIAYKVPMLDSSQRALTATLVKTEDTDAMGNKNEHELDPELSRTKIGGSGPDPKGLGYYALYYDYSKGQDNKVPFTIVDNSRAKVGDGTFAISAKVDPENPSKNAAQYVKEMTRFGDYEVINLDDSTSCTLSKEAEYMGFGNCYTVILQKNVGDNADGPSEGRGILVYTMNFTLSSIVGKKINRDLYIQEMKNTYFRYIKGQVQEIKFPAKFSF
jgi:hypothetical protein